MSDRKVMTVCVDEWDALAARVEQLEKGLKAVADLMDESRGVYGLHLNDDPAPWDELRTGGAFEDWLIDLDTALAPAPDKEKP